MVRKTVELPQLEVTHDLELDPARTGLVVVDMQNDFVDPEGALAIDGAAETIPKIGHLLAWARARGTGVFFTQDTHREDDPEWRIWGRHAKRRTWGWRIVDALSPRDHEPVYEKARYDGFYGTSLDHDLRVRGIDTLVICGTVANVCVHYTAASASLRWYRVIHPVDALSAASELDMKVALHQAKSLFQATLTETDAFVGP